MNIIELFGGIGAPRRALLDLGVNVNSLDYVEIDAPAARAYNAMYGENYPTKDVRGYDVANIKSTPDMLVHGSPCQDVSVIGLQKGADEGSGTRSSLLYETVRILRELEDKRPRVVVWENVPGVLFKNNIHNFQKYLAALDDLGYASTYEVLNTLDFGLPQQRRRIYTVSILNGPAFDFSKIERTKYKHIREYLEPNPSARYVVRRERIISKIKPLGMQEKIDFAAPEIDDFCGTIIAKEQMSTPNAGVLRLDDGGWRVLTERECWRLQGFTDADYDAALSVNPRRGDCLSQTLYRLAGNSISTTVLASIFKNLI